MCQLIFIAIFYTTRAARVFQAFTAEDTPDGDGSNWFDARYFCEMEVNGRLADPRNSEENQAVLDICPVDRCWIGLQANWSPVNHLIISEILPDPSAVSDDKGEFIELFNPTTATINLGDFKIKDDDFDINILPSMNLEPRSYFLWCRSGSPYPLCDDTSYQGNLGNSGDEVVIVRNSDIDDTEIDRFDFTSTSTDRSFFRTSSYENTPGYDFVKGEAGEFTPGTGLLESANAGTTYTSRWEWITTGDELVFANWNIAIGNPTLNDGHARGFIYGLSSLNPGTWGDTVSYIGVVPYALDDLTFICVTDTSNPTIHPTKMPSISPIESDDDRDDSSDENAMFMSKSTNIGNVDVNNNASRREITIGFDTSISILFLFITFIGGKYVKKKVTFNNNNICTDIVSFFYTYYFFIQIVC